MRYILNKNAQMGTGHHKIHTRECKKRPNEENIIDLDECFCLMEAKDRAKQYYLNVSECRYCCNKIFCKK